MARDGCKIFFIFVPFSSLIVKKIKTIKNEENTWRYQDFTQVYHKSNHTIDDSFDMKRDRQNFLSFWDIFCPFTPLATLRIKVLKKWKKTTGDIIILHKCTKNYHQMLYNVPKIWRVTDVIFIFHFGLFYPILPP